MPSSTWQWPKYSERKKGARLKKCAQCTVTPADLPRSPAIGQAVWAVTRGPVLEPSGVLVGPRSWGRCACARVPVGGRSEPADRHPQGRCRALCHQRAVCAADDRGRPYRLLRPPQRGPLRGTPPGPDRSQAEGKERKERKKKKKDLMGLSSTVIRREGRNRPEAHRCPCFPRLRTRTVDHQFFSKSQLCNVRFLYFEHGCLEMAQADGLLWNRNTWRFGAPF